MSYFAVTREAGPAWAYGGIFDQPAVNDHAAFMNALADQGFVLFGGPLAGSENGRVRVLLIVNAESEAEIHRRLADDPWVPTQQLLTVSTEPWKILVGTETLSFRTRCATLANDVAHLRPRPRVGVIGSRSRGV